MTAERKEMQKNLCMSGELDDVLRGRKFKKVMQRRFEDIRKKYDIKQVEVEILLHLNQFPEVSASQMCSDLELNKGQVSRALLDLCLKQFICPSMHPEDRRRTSYGFLEKGMRFLKEAERERARIFRRMTEGISREEMETTRNVAGKMIENMEKLSM